MEDGGLTASRSSIFNPPSSFSPFRRSLRQKLVCTPPGSPGAIRPVPRGISPAFQIRSAPRRDNTAPDRPAKPFRPRNSSGAGCLPRGAMCGNCPMQFFRASGRYRRAVAGALDRAQGVGLLPAVFQAQGLRDELGVHQTAPACLDRQVILPARRALLFNPHPHLVDLFLPARRETRGRRSFDVAADVRRLILFPCARS